LKQLNLIIKVHILLYCLHLPKKIRIW